MKPATKHPRLVWSAKVILILSVAVIVTTTGLIFALSDRSILVETGITLSVLALCLFLFLTTGLYLGVRLESVRKQELDRTIEEYHERQNEPRPSSLATFFFPAFNMPDPGAVSLPNVNLPDASSLAGNGGWSGGGSAGGGGGSAGHWSIDFGGGSDIGDVIFGCLLSLIWSLVAAALLAILVALMTQFIAALPVFIAALYWIFYRALRVVFARSHACKGQLLKSAGYGLLYTLLYSGWTFILLGLVSWLSAPRV